jgi:dGTP triphosphohydrolase
MNRELQAQIQQLKDEFLNQKNSHLEDALDLFIQQTENKIEHLEAEATQLKAQNRDLYQQLWNQGKELESCYQEVRHTNRELCQALNSNQVSYSQAIASAKKILCDDQPSSEALARLLQVIYGQDVSAIALGGLRR